MPSIRRAHPGSDEATQHVFHRRQRFTQVDARHLRDLSYG
jgi:hypothetical protein